MPDDVLARLARAYLQSGAPEDGARWLSERVRVGDLSEPRIAIAAHFGDAAARLVLANRAPRVMSIELDGVDMRFWHGDGSAQGPPTLGTLDADRLAGAWVVAWRALDRLLLPAALVALAGPAAEHIDAGLRAGVRRAVDAAMAWVDADGSGSTDACEHAIAAVWPSARVVRHPDGRVLVVSRPRLRSFELLVFLAASSPFHGPAEQHVFARGALRDLALAWSPARVRSVLAEGLVPWALRSIG